MVDGQKMAGATESSHFAFCNVCCHDVVCLCCLFLVAMMRDLLWHKSSAGQWVCLCSCVVRSACR